MDERQRFAEQMLRTFNTQLQVNVAALVLAIVVLGVVLYVAVRVTLFLGWSKEYLTVIKQYVDLTSREREAVKHEVHMATAVTQAKLESKGEEIKQEIREAVQKQG